jgi:hypothetical protein
MVRGGTARGRKTRETKPSGDAMSGKFNPYDGKAFLQMIIVFVFLFGFLVAAVAVSRGV